MMGTNGCGSSRPGSEPAGASPNFWPGPDRTSCSAWRIRRKLTGEESTDRIGACTYEAPVWVCRAERVLIPASWKVNTDEDCPSTGCGEGRRGWHCPDRLQRLRPQLLDSQRHGRCRDGW